MKFNPQDSIGFLMRQAFGAMKSSINHKLRKNGYSFTMEQGGALMHLWMKDGQSQVELTEALGSEKTSIARLINSMEKSLLVVRIPSKEDKRINLIYLTKKGKEVQSFVMKSVQETLQESLQGVNKKEEEITKKVLKQIQKNLCGKNSTNSEC